MGTVWEDEGRIPSHQWSGRTFPSGRSSMLATMCNAAISSCPSSSVPCRRSSRKKNFDRFAPATGKPLAMVITGKKFQQQIGVERHRLCEPGQFPGSESRRLFPHLPLQGTQHETAYQTPRFAFDVEGALGPTFGFGSVQRNGTGPTFRAKTSEREWCCAQVQTPPRS